MAYTERFPKPRDQFQMSLESLSVEAMPLLATLKGKYIITLTDEVTGEVLDHREAENIITLDAGILAALEFRNNLTRNSLNMLAVGTGATGNLLSPDAPDNRQRKLNTPLFRKAFATTTFRTALGVASAIPTNIVDFTTVFAGNEAVGPINEMALVSAINLAGPELPNPNAYPVYDPTVDVVGLDVIVNYATFGVLVKPLGAILSLTWRLTF